MDWVLDASMALSWGLPDESSKRADRFLAQAGVDTRYWVPALWWVELANALTMARRRERITEAERGRLLELYGTLPLQTDTDLDVGLLWRLQALAQDHTLSAYDAAYLDLSQRKGCGLATLDQNLGRAAKEAGVPLFF
ncbi:MAG: type II toxin-antitoxin system VapC family toxin [Nitrospira sp.]|nr:PIN domain-containing protein [Candidatus Manganitrophaceae bacterium]HIL35647.1 PIN domain-containing protein [Candidatus Manganitrophaceae bacterium]